MRKMMLEVTVFTVNGEYRFHTDEFEAWGLDHYADNSSQPFSQTDRTLSPVLGFDSQKYNDDIVLWTRVRPVIVEVK